MNFKKISYGLLLLVLVIGVGYFINNSSSQSTKVCITQDKKSICQNCSCPRGKALPGLNSVACPDGAQPTCSALPANE